MFTRIILAIALASSVASADEHKPGRCVVITAPNEQARLVCDVPPSEQCAEATIVRPDGAIVTRKMCVYTSR